MIRPFIDGAIASVLRRTLLGRLPTIGGFRGCESPPSGGVKDVKRFSVFDSKFPTPTQRPRSSRGLIVARVEDISQTRNAFFSVHVKARQHILRVKLH